MSDSCCDNTPVNSEKPACACRCGFTRWLPYLLLVIAAALYGHSMYTKSKYGKIAATIRYQASQPFSQVLVFYRLEGRNTVVGNPCPPTLASNLMESFTKAMPMSPFKGMLEGSECEIIVVHTNGMRSAFKAVRLDNDPLNLYVGTILPENVTGNKTNGQPLLKLSTPAKVEGAGQIIGQVIDGIIAIADKLPSDEELLQKVNNAAPKMAEPDEQGE